MFLHRRCHSLLDPVAVGVVAAVVVVIEDVAAAEAENFAAAVEAEVDVVAGAEGDHVEVVPFVGDVSGLEKMALALAQK